jgi:Methyltransferase domain
MKLVGPAVRALIRDPVETLILLRERVAEREEMRATKLRGVGGFMPWPPCPYEVDGDAERLMHERLGLEWPCEDTAEFWTLWNDALAELGEKYDLGRGAFGGWGDGEPGFVRAIWCLTRHLRPSKVVETGVARGISTRFILAALERNAGGHLWSVDLPPPRSTELHEQIGAAVTKRFRKRWTYVRGSSRRRLPRLLAELGEIELFVHDSRHSKRNLLFELEHAWTALGERGILIADDVDLNCGFHDFRAAHPDSRFLISLAEPAQPDFGRQDDRGVYGIAWKGPPSPRPPR